MRRLVALLAGHLIVATIGRASPVFAQTEPLEISHSATFFGAPSRASQIA